MKRILPYLFCISFIFNWYLLTQKVSGTQQVMPVNNGLVVRTAVNEGIQVVAKRPYIKRGEVGVLALRCAPNNNCRIICSYKVGGKDFTTTRNIRAGRDGSVLCTWKVDRNTDTGTYQIEIYSAGNKLVTSYVVQ